MIVCGIVGKSTQRVLDSGVCEAGEVEMTMERPSPDHTAAADGTWVTDLTSLKSNAKNEVDIAAGEARRAWVSDGFGVMQEYEQAETEAHQYIDAVAANGGDPTGVTVPSSVQSGANYINGTPLEGANDIVSRADAMRAALATIRDSRLTGKLSIDAATDKAGITTERDNAVSALGAIRP